MKRAVKWMLLALYVAASALFVVQYHDFLRRPSDRDFREADRFLRSADVYHGEPILFSPTWLKNYATDRGRFRRGSFELVDDAPTVWLLTTEEPELARDGATPSPTSPRAP